MKKLSTGKYTTLNISNLLWLLFTTTPVIKTLQTENMNQSQQG